MAACVAEKFPPLNASCICVFAVALSWQDEHTDAIGVILRLSEASVAEGGVLMVFARMPLAVGADQMPVNWYDVPMWHAAQFCNFPG